MKVNIIREEIDHCIKNNEGLHIPRTIELSGPGAEDVSDETAIVFDLKLTPNAIKYISLKSDGALEQQRQYSDLKDRNFDLSFDEDEDRIIADVPQSRLEKLQ